LIKKNDKTQDKRAMWSWAMNDWANSAFSTTVMAGFFPVFFKQYYSAGMDATSSTAQLGLANSVGALLIALAAPILGAVSDAGGYKKRFLFLFTYLGILSTSALFLLHQGQWQLAAFVYVIASFGHAGSTCFYDSLLTAVTTEKDIDFVSALGYAVGYLGGGILFTLNVIMYLKPQIFGISDPALAIQLSFLSVGIWWAVFSIPIFLFVKEPDAIARGTWSENFSTGIHELKRTVKRFPRLKNLSLFLIAFFLYNDGVGTTMKMAVDFGLSIGFKDSDLITALLLVQFVGFPAALIFGKLSTHFHPKKAIAFSIAVYILVLIWASMMSQVWHFYAMAAMIGCVQGGIQSLSRSYYTRLIDEKRSGEFFGFFNLLGKFTGILGPLLIALTVTFTGNSRLGILSIIVVFVLGWILILRVDENQGQLELEKENFS
jgi:UMF1 family MFS transporter